MPLKILYEDNHLLVLDKPAGVLTQGDATGDLSCVELGKNYLREKYHKTGAVYLTPIHRLDRPVSGVLCLARTDKAASRLAEQFRARVTVEKNYLAAVEIKDPNFSAAGELRDYLIIGKPPTNKTQIVATKTTHAKTAGLTYTTLYTAERRGAKSAYRVLAIKLLTGYKHQIRAQLAFHGAAIIGDFKYAPAKNPQFKLNAGHAIALHAISLQFIHPTQRETLIIRAPLPEYFPLPEKYV